MHKERVHIRAIRTIVENKQRREDGGYNCIPFGLTRFGNYIPGLQKKNYTIVTASSGVGKSKFTKQLYVLTPHQFIEDNPETGMKLDILYFCLEESAENFIHSVICYKLNIDYESRIDIKDLKSMKLEHILTDDELAKVESLRPWLNKFEDRVQLIDDVKNPYGIFKTARDFIETQGEWVYKEIEWDKGNGEVEIKRVKDYFKLNHPDHYIEIVVDHLSLLHPEKGMAGLHEAMSKLSSDYALTLRDKYGCAITFVQQQMAEQEKKQFTNSGRNIDSKLEPTLSGLADNKLTQRDADEVIGAFAPERYGIADYRGYDITKLKDNYRCGLILKARDGVSNIRGHFFFDGAVSRFEELPKAADMGSDEYEYYANRVGRSVNTISFS